MGHIRNFSIIAHIDHGKSTLADRMLELTGTVERRKMRDQVLDSMDLERERGITIKMQPVRMRYKDHLLHLIDTPGHIDFAYEVSRALQAVEGAIVLVDATQGVQAQTISTLHAAQQQNLMIIPAVSKIDSPIAQTDAVKKELAQLLGVADEEVFEVSGKTGEGVEELLDAVIKKVPAPKVGKGDFARGLVFDFEYSDHRGVIVYVRVVDGAFVKGDKLTLLGVKENFTALEIGTFAPQHTPEPKLSAGEIGYIVTGVKKPGLASVGDTVARQKEQTPPLPGYMQPKPVVWASIYPEDADDFSDLKQALERLRLTDASLSFEEEVSGALGRGFRVGFLGMLHLEIITERLKREFGIAFVITTPSVQFEIILASGASETVFTPSQFPDTGEVGLVKEPWVTGTIITPATHVGSISQLLYEHEGILERSETFGDRTQIYFELPLRELYRNFFDELKSATSGFASLSYEMGDMREADVTRLDVLIGGEVHRAFSRVVSRRQVETEAHALVERLEKVLPRQQFAMKIQGRALGRIIASKTLKAFRKDVTAKLYGGDVTRKMKLLEKQKKGKKKMRQTGKVHIPQETFLKLLRPGE